MKKYIALLCLLLLFGCSQKTQELEVNTTMINSTIASSIKINSTDLTEVTNLTYIEELNDTSIDDKKLEDMLLSITDQRTEIGFFYSPICFACNAIKPKVEELEKKYNSSIKIIRYNVLDNKDLEKYNEFQIKYNLSQENRVVPIIYWEEIRLIGMVQVNTSLESLMINATTEEK
ncbi:MAG: thioredoxin family protein [Candidatus Micrarchaeota archaeon]|nr:thioredoxin family protein [Candidatus Micrarchaeota archaeon]